MALRIGLCVILLGFAQQAVAVEVPVTSTTSYLDNVGNLNNTATVYPLSTLMAQPGDFVILEALGEFSLNGTESGPNASLSSAMIGVFSASDSLLDVDAFNPRLRVVDAIEAGTDFTTDSDISQDFLIDRTVVQVPAGATHFFVAPLDGFVGDNSDDNGNFALSVTVVPEPTSAMLLASFSLIALAGNRRFRTIELQRKVQ